MKIVLPSYLFFSEHRIKLLLLTCKLVDIASIFNQIIDDAPILEQQQQQVCGRVEFSYQDWTTDVAEDEVTKSLHQPNVRQEIRDQSGKFYLLNLHFSELFCLFKSLFSESTIIHQS